MSTMLKRWTAVLLTCTIFHITALPGQAFVRSDSEGGRTQKVKRAVLDLGIGPQAAVTVRLRDKTRVSGYVSEAGANTFTVADRNTGSNISVAYGDVSAMSGRNLSTGAKIGIGVAVGVGVFFLIAYALFLNWSS